MAKLTQKEIILKLLRENPDSWFPSYSLLKASTKYGWLGSQGDRRARELAESRTIEVRHQGKYAEYRAKPIKERIIWKCEGIVIDEQLVY